jgi:hypothetical protein
LKRRMVKPALGAKLSWVAEVLQVTPRYILWRSEDSLREL